MSTILTTIKQKAVPILKAAGVTRSSLFGSYVRGDQRKTSDIDMLVEIPRGTGLFGFIALQRKLEQALGKKVDLVTYSALHPLLKKSVLSEQQSILS